MERAALAPRLNAGHGDDEQRERSDQAARRMAPNIERKYSQDKKKGALNWAPSNTTGLASSIPHRPRCCLSRRSLALQPSQPARKNNSCGCALFEQAVCRRSPPGQACNPLGSNEIANALRPQNAGSQRSIVSNAPFQTVGLQPARQSLGSPAKFKTGQTSVRPGRVRTTFAGYGVAALRAAPGSPTDRERAAASASSEIGGAARSAGAGLHADRALDHLHVPIAPLLHALRRDRPAARTSRRSSGRVR